MGITKRGQEVCVNIEPIPGESQKCMEGVSELQPSVKSAAVCPQLERLVQKWNAAEQVVAFIMERKKVFEFT